MTPKAILVLYAWMLLVCGCASMGAGANTPVSDNPVPGERVTVSNFVRAESDHMIRANMKTFGADFGQFAHLRKPTTPDNQPVIRMNQETLYSGTVLDLSKPVKITLPELGGRYMSMHVVNQDHYMLVEPKPGTYELTEDLVGTRFAVIMLDDGGYSSATSYGGIMRTPAFDRILYQEECK